MATSAAAEFSEKIYSTTTLPGTLQPNVFASSHMQPNNKKQKKLFPYHFDLTIFVTQLLFFLNLCIRPRFKLTIFVTQQ